MKKNNVGKPGKQASLHGRGKGKVAGAICAVLFVLAIIGPAILANIFDGNMMFMGYSVAFIAAILITSFRYGKHFSVFENSEADHYLKKDSVDITYRYDKYTHTK